MDFSGKIWLIKVAKRRHFTLFSGGAFLEKQQGGRRGVKLTLGLFVVNKL